MKLYFNWNLIYHNEFSTKYERIYDNALLSKLQMFWVKYFYNAGIAFEKIED